MPDFHNAVFSFPIDVFRVVAPALDTWRVTHPSLPCWRLWWNSNPGAYARTATKWRALGPERFILVAPETHFEVKLEQPVKRHLFIHFGLCAPRWGITGRLLELPASRLDRALVADLLRRIPADRRTAMSEPLLGVALVSAVLAKIESAQWVGPRRDERVQRVVATVDSNLALPWSNQAMAHLVAMSVGGFVRLFKGDVGMAPQQYLLRQRLAQARNLLLQTGISIEAVAERCGFCDRSYFSTVFRQEVGLPPATYRRRAVHLA